MSLVVAHNFAHVFDILFGILVLLLVGVPFENIDDFSTRVVSNSFAGVAVLPTGRDRVGGFEPLLKLAGGHVYEIVELFNYLCVLFDHCGRDSDGLVEVYGLGGEAGAVGVILVGLVMREGEGRS